MDDETRRLEQFKLVYDYIKFHMGLYLGTPAVVLIVAQGFGVTESGFVRASVLLMIGLYIVSGAHAGIFMGRHINTEWTSTAFSDGFGEAYTRGRRHWHHTMYWVGLSVGLLGILFALAAKLVN